MEINLNKQNMFAENKTRTLHCSSQPASTGPRLSACKHCAGRAASGSRHEPGECAEARWGGCQVGQLRDVSVCVGRLGSKVWVWGSGGARNSWERGTRTGLEQFSHWPFPTGGCLLSDTHGNPHPQFSASEGLHSLAQMLSLQRTGLHWRAEHCAHTSSRD